MARKFSKLLLIGNAAPAIAQKALNRTAEEIGELAQTYAPVRTGELRNSKRIEIAYLVALVGFTAPYAGYVNFGTSRQAANPFFSAAWFQAVENFNRNLKEELAQAVR